MADKPTLLAVDDEPDILDFLERVFRREYVVLRAENAEEAEAILDGRVPDLLISDQRMPGKTGMELLGEVAEAHPLVTRVLLSGFSDLPEITQAAESGLVHAYVVKPVDSQRLREAVREARETAERGPWRQEEGD